MLDDRSEQKVTTLDKDLARKFLPSMSPIHPVVLEKKFAEMFLCMICSSGVTFVPINLPTWLPGDIIASDWLNFLKIFFSDTTG
jgi:hypothetical protein